MLTWRRFEPARRAEPMLSRRVASRKRKEMEATGVAPASAGGASVKKEKEKEKEEEEDKVEVEVEVVAVKGGNQLLAGFLAHEFLTKGTFMGQRWDPALAVAEPVVRKPIVKREAAAADRAKPARYADVAQLVKTEGACVPGVVNPAQLARWLQM